MPIWLHWKHSPSVHHSLLFCVHSEQQTVCSPFTHCSCPPAAKSRHAELLRARSNLTCPPFLFSTFSYTHTQIHTHSGQYQQRFVAKAESKPLKTKEVGCTAHKDCCVYQVKKKWGNFNLHGEWLYFYSLGHFHVFVVTLPWKSAEDRDSNIYQTTL